MYSLKHFVTTVRDGPVDPDDKSPLDTVLMNREMVFINHDVKSFVRMRSVHGTDEIMFINDENRAQWEDKLTTGPIADALVTMLPDLALEYDPGDRPVYVLFHPKYSVLALVPAGQWGSVNKVLAKVVKKCAFVCHIPIEEFMRDLKVVQSAPSCPEASEMEFFQVFTEDLDDWKPFISGDYIVQGCETKGCKRLVANGSITVDLDGFNANLLRSLDVRDENIEPPSVDPSALTKEVLKSHLMVLTWMASTE